MNKRKAVRERLLSLMLAMLLVVTGIPVNGLVVNAEEIEATTEESTTAVENTDETDEVSDDVIDTEEVNDENEEKMPVAEEPADEGEEKEEKGGERYQVIAGDYAEYVSIYKEVDGSMEEVADAASESFAAGDKVCVVVKEGYAWTLLVDDSELEADEELEGYVFTIGEEDLELAEVYAIEAGDGAEALDATTTADVLVPFKVTTVNGVSSVNQYITFGCGISSTSGYQNLAANQTTWNHASDKTKTNILAIKLTSSESNFKEENLYCTVTLGENTLEKGSDSSGYYKDYFIRNDSSNNCIYVIFNPSGEGFKDVTASDELHLDVKLLNRDGVITCKVDDSLPSDITSSMVCILAGYSLGITSYDAINSSNENTDGSYKWYIKNANNFIYKLTRAGGLGADYLDISLKLGDNKLEAGEDKEGKYGSYFVRQGDANTLYIIMNANDVASFGTSNKDTDVVLSVSYKTVSPSFTSEPADVFGYSLYKKDASTNTYSLMDNDTISSYDEFAVVITSDNDELLKYVEVTNGDDKLNKTEITISEPAAAVAVAENNAIDAYTFTVKDKVDITASLKNNIVIFEDGEYTAKNSSSKEFPSFYVSDETSTETITITPAEGKSLTSIIVKNEVTGEEKTYSYSEIQGALSIDGASYDLELTYGTNSKGIYTISASVGVGSTLSIETNGTVTAVGTSLDNNKNVVGASSCLVSNSTATTLYIELGTDYCVYNNQVTLTNIKTGVEKTITVSSYNGKSPDTIYKANLGILSADMKVTVTVVKRDGYTINFSGSNFTASVSASGESTVTGLKDGYPYVGSFSGSGTDTSPYVAKTINLTAVDNYRFTDVYAGGLNAVIADGGKTATITGVLPTDFSENELTITATTEKTVALTISGKNCTVNTDFTVEVLEDNYTYHLNGNTHDGVVDIENGTYSVSLDNLVTLNIRLSDAKKSEYKVSSIKLGKKEYELAVSDTTTEGVYTTSFTLSNEEINIKEDANITIELALNESNLQGISFAKEHYSVSSTTDSNFNFAQSVFENDDVYVLLTNKVVDDSTSFVFTVKPETNYTISQLKYADVYIYDVNDTDGNISVDGITVAKNTNFATDGSLDVTISSKNYFTKGNQESFEVVTSAVALDSSAANTYTGFELVKPETQTVSVVGEDTTTVLFNEDELFSYVNGKVYTDTTTGKYKLYNGADYVTFVVTADSNLKIGLKFWNGSTEQTITIDESGNTYRVAAKDLVSNNIDKVEITCEVQTEDVVFNYNKELVTITATGPIDGMTNVPAKDADGNALTDGSYVKTYKVRKGKNITVSVKANTDNDDVRYATITGIDGQSFREDESKFTIAADKANNAINVTATALTFPIVKDSSSNVLKSEDDGSYFISYGSYYYASVKSGKDFVIIDKAEMVIDGVTTALAISNNEAAFYPEQKYAGKEATVNLKIKNDDGTYTTVTSFKFVIANVLTEVNVDGVVNGVLTQTVDTEKSYALDIPDGTNIKDLKVVFTGCFDAHINYVTKELVITTDAKAASENAATVSLVNGQNTLKTITVNTVNIVGVTAATPSIEYVGSTPTSMKVKLSAAGVPDVTLANGSLVYKVEFKTKSNSTNKDNSYTKVFYVPKSGDNTYATLQLFASDVTKEGIYTVDVTLMHCTGTVDKNYQIATTSVIALSSKTSVTDTDEFTVKPSYYTNVDELKLTATAGVVYRGQTDVAIANVDFGENNSTLEDAKVTIIDANNKKYSDGYVKYNTVYVTIGTNVALGNATVIVDGAIPTGKEEKTVPATASMSIKVEQGVWDLELSNVPNTLYKTDKKAASFKATATLNDNITNGLKNKTVNWGIYKSVTETTTGLDLTPFTASDALYGMVTVKNGTVTVNKDYTVSTNANKNTFYVVAISDANTSEYDYKKVVITNTAVTLNENNFVLVEYNKTTGNYDKLENQTVITSDKLAKASKVYIAAVKDGLNNSSYYTVDNFITTTLTVKSSNKNLKVEPTEFTNSSGETAYLYHLSTPSTMKSVVVTFTAMDGGKSSVKKVFAVDYANMDNLVLEVNGKVVTGTYSFVGTTEDTLTVRLGYKDENGDFQNFEGTLNAKVNVKKGKILKSDTVNNEYLVKLTSASASFNVTNNTSKNVISCTLTNTAYSKTAVPTVVADKKSIVANSVDEQSITYTFKKAVNYKYVKVQIDKVNQISLENKKSYVYDAFLRAIGASSGDDFVVLPIEDGSFTLNFLADDNAYYAVPAGAYKLYFSYGDYKASEFVPATKAGSVTVKAVAAGKAAYEVTTSYNMSIVDTTSVALKATVGKDTTVKFVKTASTILDGKRNAFAELFTVNKYGELTLASYADLKAYDDANKTQLVNTVINAAGKEAGSAADFTGYVYYRVNGSADLEKAKVTVTLSDKALQSYTTSGIHMLAAGSVASEVTVFADKKEVGVAKAKLNNGSFSVKVTDETLVMTSSNAPSVGDSTASVKIIPSTSFFADYTNADLTKYGVDVTVNVTAKSTYSPVATLDSSNIGFDTYDGKGNYIAEISYTSNIANKITGKSYSFVDSNDAKLKNYLTLTETNGVLTLIMTKNNLDKAVEDGYLSYGASKNITLTVKYCNLVEETYPISLKFPTKASFDAKDIFTNIRKALWSDVSGNPNNVEAYVFPSAVDFTEALELKENGSAADYVKALEEAVTNAVESAVKAQLAAGANIAVTSVTPGAITSTDASVLVTVVLSGSDVSDTVANVSDTYAANLHHGIAGTTYTIDTKVYLPSEDDVLTIYKNKLAEFVDSNDTNYLGGLKVTNALTVEAIAEAANAYVLDGASSIYGIYATENSKIEPATSVTLGKVNVTLVLKEKGVEKDNGTVKDTIDYLDSAAMAANYFAELLGKASPSFNSSTKADTILALADEAIAKVNNSNIARGFADDGAFEYKYTTVKDNAGNDTSVLTGLKAVVEFTEASVYATIPVNVDVNFTFNGSSITSAITAEDLVKAVNDAIGSNNLAKLYLTNDSAASYANILEAAQKALGNAPYEVQIVWTWVKTPTFEEDGSVIYTVSFSALDGGDSDVASKATEICKKTPYEQTIFADKKYQTFTEAKAAISDYFLKAKFDEVKGTWVSGSDIQPTVILNALKGSVANITTNNESGFTVEYVKVMNNYFTKYVDNCIYTPATYNANGNVFVAVVLTEYDANGDVVYSDVLEMNKTIDSLAQDFDTAKGVLNGLQSNATLLNKKTERADIVTYVYENIKQSAFEIEVSAIGLDSTTKKNICSVKITSKSNASDTHKVDLTW